MADAHQYRRQSDRPLSVTLVVIGVFVLGLANFWRAIALFQQRTLLNELGATPDPLFRSLGALIWAVVFILLAVSMWRRRASVRLITPGLLLIYGVYQQVVTNLFTLSTNASIAWAPIAIIAAVTIFAAWALNRKASRKYFGTS